MSGSWERVLTNLAILYFFSVLYKLLEGQDTLNFQQNLPYVLKAAKMSPEVGKRLDHSCVCWQCLVIFSHKTLLAFFSYTLWAI